MSYIVHFDETSNKYLANPPGNDFLKGEGTSLYAAIDDLEDKMKHSGSFAKKSRLVLAEISV